MKFSVHGMSCASCVSHVEHAAKDALKKNVPDIVFSEETVIASLLTESLQIRFPRSLTDEEKRTVARAVWEAVRAAGYAAEYADQRDIVTENREKEAIDTCETCHTRTWDEKNRFIRLILSAILCVILMAVSMGPVWQKNVWFYAVFQAVIAGIVICINGQWYGSGISALLHGAPNMNTLVAVGSGSAFLFGIVTTVRICYFCCINEIDAAVSLGGSLYLDSAAVIVTLVSIGKLLEARASHRAGNAIRALATLAPDTAVIKNEDGLPLRVNVNELKIGDTVLLYAGDRVPADGFVIAGNGAADESALSGESMPVEKNERDPLYTASVLSDGYLEMSVQAVGENTTLSHMMDLLEDAAASRAPVARLADRVSAVFVPTVMSIAAITFIIWMLCGAVVSTALRHAVCVLVISCPCALGLATPTAITVATGRAASLGILFRSAAALERAAAVKSVYLDKTGTVTRGVPTLRKIRTAPGISEEYVLKRAAALESVSSHPLAVAVCTACSAAYPGTAPVSPDSFEVLPSVGVRGTADGDEWFIGKGNERAIPSSDEDTVLTLTKNGEYVGSIFLWDEPRAESADVIRQLHAMGMETVILSGDGKGPAGTVARAIGADAVFAGLLPENKVDLIRDGIGSKRKRGNDQIMMVGDGINDAPALAAADVGVAVGSGRDVALDSADVVLTGSGIASLPVLLNLSRKAMKIIRENLFWALLYNSVCIPVAAGVLYPLWGISLSPMLAALCMSFSSVTVSGRPASTVNSRTFDKSNASDTVLSNVAICEASRGVGVPPPT